MQVFAQRELDRLPLSELDQTARRFFSTKVGLREPETTNACGFLEAHLVVAEEPKGAPVRGAFFVRVEVRPVLPDDLARLGENREAQMNGMLALAARCKSIVEIEGEDRNALLLAAVLAATLLGPIVLASGAVFGVKTARERLAELPVDSAS